jgi:N-acetylmuramoyl-L-alanine amidase
MAAMAAVVALGAAACGGGGSSGGSTTSAGVQPTAFQTIPVTTQVPLTSAPPSGQPGTTAAGGGAGSGGAGGGAGADAGTYTVRDGDTLVGIAKKLGVTLQALLDANGMNTNSLIYKGLKLKIPGANAGGGATTAPASGGSTGTTAAGSGGSAAPTSAPPPTTPTTLPGAGGTYTVVSGDTWFGIAKKLGVKAEDLAAFNDKTTKDAIHPGDKLQVPPPSTSST